ERHGQGAFRALDSRLERAAAETVRRHQLRRAGQGNARERALRPRERRLHRRAPAQERQARAGAPGHGVFDEIGDLTLELQTKLLRVLQEREFERLGGTALIEVDLRIIAATNRELEAAV